MRGSSASATSRDTEFRSLIGWCLVAMETFGRARALLLITKQLSASRPLFCIASKDVPGGGEGGGGVAGAHAPLAIMGPRPHNRSPRATGVREPTSAEAYGRVLGPKKTFQAPAGAPWSELKGPRLRANEALWRPGGLLGIDEEPMGP